MNQIMCTLLLFIVHGTGTSNYTFLEENIILWKSNMFEAWGFYTSHNSYYLPHHTSFTDRIKTLAALQCIYFPLKLNPFFFRAYSTFSTGISNKMSKTHARFYRGFHLDILNHETRFKSEVPGEFNFSAPNYSMACTSNEADIYQVQLSVGPLYILFSSNTTIQKASLEYIISSHWAFVRKYSIFQN